MYSDITCAILAGGKSSRMGEDKAFLKFNGKSIIENILLTAQQVFTRVIIISNETAKYSSFGFPVYRDIHQTGGPIAGIHSALSNSSTGRNFILSCDIPLINKETIEFIINYPSGAPVIVSKADGFIQQLAGVYSKSLLPEIEILISDLKEAEINYSITKKTKCPVLQLIENVNGTVIDIQNEYSGYFPGTFLNLNKPSDYQTLLDYPFL